MELNVSCLLPRKAKALERIYAQYEERVIEAPRCLRVERGRLTLRPLNQIVGAYLAPRPEWVVDDDDRVTEIAPTASVGGGETPEVKLKGRVVFYGYMHSGMWGHFLLDTLSRLWYRPDDVDAYLFALPPNHPRQLKGNFLAAMKALGLTGKKVYMVKGTAEVDGEVIVPALSVELDKYWSEAYRGVIADIKRGIGAADVPVTAGKRVFLTRSALKSAASKDLNIGWLDRTMLAAGYEVVAPERLTLREMAEMLSSCEEVATVSGTVAHNLLFGRPGQRVTIFERTCFNNMYQAVVSLAMDSCVEYVDACLVATAASLNCSGPFLYFPTATFRRWAASRGYDADAGGLFTNAQARRLANKQVRMSRRFYGYVTQVEEWTLDQADVQLEHIMECNKLIGAMDKPPTSFWNKLVGAVRRRLGWLRPVGFALLLASTLPVMAMSRCGSASRQPQEAQAVGIPSGVADVAITPADAPARVDSLLRALPADTNPVTFFANAFLGTPYVAGTLEGDGPERLTVNLNGLDCTTYVENVLALAKAAGESREPTWNNFAAALRSIRYRGGAEPAGRYAARLHYMSDWAADNIRRGNFIDITPDLPGASNTVKTLDFMSSHRSAYPALAADDTAFSEIKAVEGGFRGFRYPSISTERLSKGALSKLRDGDIVVLLTGKEGLDASHVGFIRVDADGTVRLQHASSRAGKVVVDELPLVNYLKRNRKAFTGIRVLRPTFSN